MSLENLTNYNYRTVLQKLSDRLHAADSASHTFSTFSKLDDDLYAYLLLKRFDGFPQIKDSLPDWPSDSVRTDSVRSDRFGWGLFFV